MIKSTDKYIIKTNKLKKMITDNLSFGDALDALLDSQMRINNYLNKYSRELATLQTSNVSAVYYI